MPTVHLFFEKNRVMLRELLVCNRAQNLRVLLIVTCQFMSLLTTTASNKPYHSTQFVCSEGKFIERVVIQESH